VAVNFLLKIVQTGSGPNQLPIQRVPVCKVTGVRCYPPSFTKWRG